MRGEPKWVRAGFVGYRRKTFAKAYRPYGSPRQRLSMMRRILMPLQAHELKAFAWLRRNRWKK